MFARSAATDKWMLFIKWTLFNMAGMGAAYFLAGLIASPDDETLYYATITIQWFSMGVVIGSMQWLALRNWIRDPVRWVIVVGVGYVIAAYVSFPIIMWDMYYELNLPYELNRLFQLDEVLYGAVFGTILGFAQWIILRKYFHQAGWWIAGSFAGWTLGRFLGEIIPFDWSQARTGVLYEAIVNFIAVTVMGFVLVKLFSRSVSEMIVTDG